ncbi:MAG: hypothetical protein M0031_14625 [Thermaerobacter sp.]|jgi:hypothetical protein|nr:hypothetical protein [Thermaerobacter sp.]
MLSVIDATGLPEVAQWLSGDLELEGGRVQVVGRAVRLGDIVRLVGQHKPGVLIMSTGFGDPRSLAGVLPDVKKASAKTRVIILHGRSSDATSKLLTLAANLGYYDFIGPFATVSDVAELIEHPRSYQEAMAYPLVDSEVIHFQAEEEEQQQAAAPAAPPEPAAPAEPVGAGSLYDRVRERQTSERVAAAVSPAAAGASQLVLAPPSLSLPGSEPARQRTGAAPGRRTSWPLVAVLAVLVLVAAGLVFRHSLFASPSKVGTVFALNGQAVQPPTGSAPGWVNPNSLPATAGLALTDLLEGHLTQYGNLVATLQIGAPPNLRQTLVASFPDLKNIGGTLSAKVVSGTATVQARTADTGLVKVAAVVDVFAGGQLAENHAHVLATYTLEKVAGGGWRLESPPSKLGVVKGTRTAGGGLGCT